VGGLGRSLLAYHWRSYVGLLACQSVGTAVGFASLLVLLGAGAGDGVVFDTADTNRWAKQISGLQTANNSMAVMLVATGFAILFTSASTVGFAVSGRRRELALLRLSGASPHQIQRLVLREALGCGLVATVVGFVIGGAALPLYTRALVAVGGAPEGFHPQLRLVALVIAGAASLIAGLAGGWLPAWRISRVKPIEALGGAAVGRQKLGWLRWAVGLGAAAGVAWLLGQTADSNTFNTNSVGLLVLTVTALTALAPVIVPPMALAASWLLRPFQPGSAVVAGQHARWNARRSASMAAPVLLFTVMGGGFFMMAQTSQAVGTLAQARSVDADAVVAALPWRNAAGALKGLKSKGVEGVAVAQSDLWGWEAQSPSTFPTLTWLDPGTAKDKLGIHVLAGSLADVHGVNVASSRHEAEVGRTYQLQAPDGEQVKVKVAAVIGATPYLNSDFAVDRASFPVSAASVEVFMWGRGGQERVAEAARAVVAGGSVETKEQWDASRSTRGFASQARGTWLLLGAVLVLAAVSLAQTTAASVRQRQREFGLLRCVGGSRGQVTAAALMDAALVLVTALILSAVGLGLVYWKLSVYTSATGLDMRPFLPLGPLAVLAATALSACLLASGAATVGVNRRLSRAA
jgi:putative ABC transport system permease protein